MVTTAQNLKLNEKKSKRKDNRQNIDTLRDKNSYISNPLQASLEQLEIEYNLCDD